VEFDLHGIAGIRLIDPSVGDVAAVSRQLGLVHQPIKREADITVRFVERLPGGSPLRYLGIDDAGFTEDTFSVLRTDGGAAARAQIDFSEVGGTSHITCESGLGAVPQLIAILNLTVLAKGVLPLHASAFTFNGLGVLVTGWAKGGKTETLLGFMARGAEYIGDEWIYVAPESGRLYGIPEPIKVWDSHLIDLPQYRAVIGRNAQARLKLLGAAATAGKMSLSGRAQSRLAGRVVSAVERQRFVHIDPRILFGSDRCALEGQLDRIVLVVSHADSKVTLEQIKGSDVARRMVFSLQFERLSLMGNYLKFRFAFPEARNAFLEEAGERSAELALSALASKDAWAVYHPYPAPIPAIVEALTPLLD
jgi:hypothetical protein